ncbi:MAG: cation transporter [Firmicutes bacterium]|nr:cation transporter [Bacillota bacterium]
MNEKVGIVGAIGAALLASVCCLGPVVLAGLGLGAVAVAQSFAPYRPLFLALTALFLGAGFYFAYRKPKQATCEGAVCEAPRAARWGRPLLWLATMLVIALVAFPYYYASLQARLDKHPAADRTPAQTANFVTAQLEIGGMTCEGCASLIRSKLLETPGVVQAEVHYPAGTARVTYDPARADLAGLLAKIENAGYRAVPVAKD